MPTLTTSALQMPMNGEKVTIIVTPDEGYELESISVISRDGARPVSTTSFVINHSKRMFLLHRVVIGCWHIVLCIVF